MNNDAIQKKQLLVEQWCKDAKNIILPEKGTNDDNSFFECGACIGGQKSLAETQDRELREAVKNNNPIEAFKKAPLNGCLTVMTMARIKSGFNPTLLDDPDASQKFSNYSENLQKAPFFHLEQSDVSHLERHEKTWDSLVQSVLDLYDGVSGEDKNSIKESIGNLAKAAMNKAGVKQTKNLFVQSTINYTSEIQVFILWSKIQMTYESGKSTSTQEIIDISKLKLRFDKEMWPYYAEIVLKYNISFIEEWLKENALPKQAGIRETVCFCKDLP